MRAQHRLSAVLSVATVIAAVGFSACSERATDSAGGTQAGQPSSAQGDEPEGPTTDEISEAGDQGEESGTQCTLEETYDQVRFGARLILTYDAQAEAFSGTVANTTTDPLRLVRIEVHLSNGVELGPTTPLDLAHGQTANVNLPATDNRFTTWSAHAEVGEGEHDGSESGEHGGEHRD